METAPYKTHNAKMLKLADKICNVRELIDAPPPGWPFERRREYLLWTERVVTGLRGSNEKLEKHYDELLIEGKQLFGL